MNPCELDEFDPFAPERGTPCMTPISHTLQEHPWLTGPATSVHTPDYSPPSCNYIGGRYVPYEEFNLDPSAWARSLRVASRGEEDPVGRAMRLECINYLKGAATRKCEQQRRGRRFPEMVPTPPRRIAPSPLNIPYRQEPLEIASPTMRPAYYWEKYLSDMIAPPQPLYHLTEDNELWCGPERRPAGFESPVGTPTCIRRWDGYETPPPPPPASYFTGLMPAEPYSPPEYYCARPTCDNAPGYNAFDSCSELGSEYYTSESDQCPDSCSDEIDETEETEGSGVDGNFAKDIAQAIKNSIKDVGRKSVGRAARTNILIQTPEGTPECSTTETPSSEVRARLERRLQANLVERLREYGIPRKMIPKEEIADMDFINEVCNEGGFTYSPEPRCSTWEYEPMGRLHSPDPSYYARRNEEDYYCDEANGEDIETATSTYPPACQGPLRASPEQCDPCPEAVAPSPTRRRALHQLPAHKMPGAAKFTPMALGANTFTSNLRPGLRKGPQKCMVQPGRSTGSPLRRPPACPQPSPRRSPSPQPCELSPVPCVPEVSPQRRSRSPSPCSPPPPPVPRAGAPRRALYQLPAHKMPGAAKFTPMANAQAGYSSGLRSDIYKRPKTASALSSCSPTRRSSTTSLPACSPRGGTQSRPTGASGRMSLSGAGLPAPPSACRVRPTSATGGKRDLTKLPAHKMPGGQAFQSAACASQNYSGGLRANLYKSTGPPKPLIRKSKPSGQC